MGALINFEIQTITWMGRQVEMKATDKILHNFIKQIEKFHNHFEMEVEEDYDFLSELYANDVVIMDQKYQVVSPDEVVE